MTTTENTNLRSDWGDARKACKTIGDREALGLVIGNGWTPEELAEFARVCFFRNGKDYPTARSYRDAIRKIESDIAWRAAKPTAQGLSYRWRKEFQAHGSKPIPPRDPATLKRRDKFPVDEESWAWPYHTPEHRAEVESIARQRYSIAEHVPVPAWAFEIARVIWVEKGPLQQRLVA